jgi:rod shape-determining protein MreD
MRFFCYIGISLAIVVCRTTLLPWAPAMENFFDLFLAFVVYLAVFRPLHECIPLLLFAGILMDTLSGGPFGLYLTSYVWLFIGLRLVTLVIRVDAPIPLVALMVAGVLWQNLVFVATLMAFELTRLRLGDMLGVFTEQVGWVLLAGPLLAVLMRTVEHRTRPASRRPSAPAERAIHCPAP